jgi:rubrerythrin
MSIAFSSQELLNIAIGIEQRGISFYDIMAKSTDNEEARTIFEALVEMERVHLETFQNIKRSLDESQTSKTSSDEDSAYLEALIENAVFSDDLITSEMATQADSDIKAIELGINAEKDSILFYYEMKDIVPPNLLPVINGIIAEEKSHLRQLSVAKKNLTLSDNV